jgi:predicted small lipoprotein YifL
MSRLAFAFMLLAFIAGSLAACGRKGLPEAPQGQADTLHRHYPSQE